jgi:16S rRNA G966 N2-methylase RsmD
LDPPYHSKCIPDALRALVKFDLLKPMFTIVCESQNASDVFMGDPALEKHFSVRKQVRYGIANITILEALSEQGGEEA